MKTTIKLIAHNPGEAHTLSQVLEVASAVSRPRWRRTSGELADSARVMLLTGEAELQPEHFRPVAAAIGDLLEHGEHFKPAALVREGLRDLRELLKVAAPAR